MRKERGEEKHFKMRYPPRMTRIIVRRQHSTTLKRARTGAGDAAEKLAAEYQLAIEWVGHTLRFETSGVSGKLVVNRRELTIDVRLDFMMALLQPVIEREIQRILDEQLGPEEPD